MTQVEQVVVRRAQNGLLLVRWLLHSMQHDKLLHVVVKGFVNERSGSADDEHLVVHAVEKTIYFDCKEVYTDNCQLVCIAGIEVHDKKSILIPFQTYYVPQMEQGLWLDPDVHLSITEIGNFQGEVIQLFPEEFPIGRANLNKDWLKANDWFFAEIVNSNRQEMGRLLKKLKTIELGPPHCMNLPREF